MSKASEYARNYKELNFGRDDDLGCDIAAYVTKGGNLCITKGAGPINPKEAIKFAHWILDTFEDKE